MPCIFNNCVDTPSHVSYKSNWCEVGTGQLVIYFTAYSYNDLSLVLLKVAFQATGNIKT